MRPDPEFPAIGGDDPDPEGTVRARIARLTAAEYDPKLESDDLDDLVGIATIPDEAGRNPTDTDWVETYDINRAVQMGWEIKAARAAGDFRFEEDNQAFYREHVFSHCRDMAKRYNRRAVYVPVRTDV
jgi:hypothetical protein